MVVDDSLTVRKVSQRLLEREGYRVLLAKDGVDALEQMQETRPDLMLVDIEMPRMDGFDLTRHVRGNEATHGIPIIMITSRTADKHRNYALDLGVDAYFGKPFQEDVLLAAISGLLGERCLIRLRDLFVRTQRRRGPPPARGRRLAATFTAGSVRLPASHAEPLQGPHPCLFVIHHRHRIIPPQRHARLRPADAALASRGAWIAATFQPGQLRQPAADEGAVRVEAARLRTGLKMRNQGWASQPVDAAHCQPPLFELSS